MSRLSFVLAAAGLFYPAAGAAAQQLDAPIDSVRLLADLATLAHDSMAGRGTGTPGAARARTFLEESLLEAGATPAYERLAYEFEWRGGTGYDVVGLVDGLDAGGPAIVLTAHYDHLGIRDGEIFNGADDNASGVAALLEITRRLVETPPRHDIVVAFMDAEEQGFQGSQAFVDAPPIDFGRIALNVNLDMVSRTDGLLWIGGTAHTPALRDVLAPLVDLAPLTLRFGHDRPGAPEGDDWTNASDHAPFHEVGIPFIYFGVEDHEDYHRATDDIERIDPGEYVAAARTILAAVRLLDAALPLEAVSGR